MSTWWTVAQDIPVWIELMGAAATAGSALGIGRVWSAWTPTPVEEAQASAIEMEAGAAASAEATTQLRGIVRDLSAELRDRDADVVGILERELDRSRAETNRLRAERDAYRERCAIYRARTDA